MDSKTGPAAPASSARLCPQQSSAALSGPRRLLADPQEVLPDVFFAVPDSPEEGSDGPEPDEEPDEPFADEPFADEPAGADSFAPDSEEPSCSVLPPESLFWEPSPFWACDSALAEARLSVR